MKNNDTLWRIFFFLEKLADHREAYNALKSNDAERKNSKYFGLKAVKYNIILFILMAAFAGLAIGTYAFFAASGIWQGILLLIVAIAVLPYSVIFFVLALNCDIKQMYLNNQSIGWVSLMFTLLIFVAAVAGVVVGIILI